MYFEIFPNYPNLAETHLEEIQERMELRLGSSEGDTDFGSQG